MSTERFLSINEVCKLTSLSRTSIHNHRQTGDFPTPVRISEKRIAFLASEIEIWIKQRIVERDREKTNA